jgi:hypothetical protein
LRIGVSAGRAERLERQPKPRPRDLAVIDGVANRNRLIAAARIARARETLLQHLAHEYGRSERAVDIRMRQQILGRVRATGKLRRDGT